MWHSGSDITNFLSAEKMTLNFGIISKHLYSDHVPLYFFIFRIVSIFFVGSSSKWIGLGINLVLYILLYFSLSKLIYMMIIDKLKDIDNTLIIPKALSFICLLHPVVVSMATTIRMYILISLVIVNTIICYKNDSQKFNFRLFVIATIGLLTHFYYWIWIGIYVFVDIIMQQTGLVESFKKRVIDFSNNVKPLLCSLLVTTIIYPYWTQRLFTYKGATSIINIFKIKNIFSSIYLSFNNLTNLLLFNNLFTFVIILLIVLCIVYVKCTDNKLMLNMLISSIIYLLFVTYTQPTNELRYIWNIALLILMIILCVAYSYFTDISYLNAKFRIIITSIFMIVVTIMNISLSFINDCANIMCLKYRPSNQYNELKQNYNIPWLIFLDQSITEWEILCSAYDFQIPNRIMSVDINGNNIDNKLNNDCDEVIVYFYRNNCKLDDCISFISNNYNRVIFDYSFIATSYQFDVYKLRLRSI